eukprot:CAMPEP_0197845240 /NCGR_PEP_ID=MMETSP1438-20131217/2186_1 /TAXON_ID=1461541 /ORGANISM="Pterosperma sp., Strain CCMP1384" /LENGTH=218 /DNA_ID=CAMNT_0043456435 /DNA_START=251 /DNA_END=907 /DNA_ORIENTATION=+
MAIRDVLGAGQREWGQGASALLGITEQALLELVPLDGEEEAIKEQQSRTQLAVKRLHKMVAEAGLTPPQQTRKRKVGNNPPEESHSEDRPEPRPRKAAKKTPERLQQEKRERLRKRIRDSGYTGDVDVLEETLARLSEKAVKSNGRGSWMVQKYAKLHSGARSATLYWGTYGSREEAEIGANQMMVTTGEVVGEIRLEWKIERWKEAQRRDGGGDGAG